MTSPATGGRIPRPLGLILIRFEQKLSRRVNPGKNRASELYHARLSCKGKGPGDSCGAKRQTDEEVHQAPQNRKKKEENMSWKWRNSRTRGARSVTNSSSTRGQLLPWPDKEARDRRRGTGESNVNGLIRVPHTHRVRASWGCAMVEQGPTAALVKKVNRNEVRLRFQFWPRQRRS